jgi:hypothetical protein
MEELKLQFLKARKCIESSDIDGLMTIIQSNKKILKVKTKENGFYF